MATKKNLEKKIKAFEEMRMTTHWPCKIKLFPKTPRTFGRELPEFKTISKPILTDIGSRLAGF
jgi:hypothetical protein